MNIRNWCLYQIERRALAVSNWAWRKLWGRRLADRQHANRSWSN